MPAQPSHLPARVAIYLTGTGLASHGHVIDEFLWSHPHQKHIYQGREFSDPKELVTAWRNAMRKTGKHKTIEPLLLPCEFPNLKKAREAKQAKEGSNDGLGTTGPAVESASGGIPGPDADVCSH